MWIVLRSGSLYFEGGRGFGGRTCWTQARRHHLGSERHALSGCHPRRSSKGEFFFQLFFLFFFLFFITSFFIIFKKSAVSPTMYMYFCHYDKETPQSNQFSTNFEFFFLLGKIDNFRILQFFLKTSNIKNVEERKNYYYIFYNYYNYKIYNYIIYL